MKMTPWKKTLLGIALVVSGALAHASAATFTVTNTADSGAGSLRQAVLDASAAPSADTVVFDASFNEPRTITLLTAIGISPTAAADTLTITGPGPDLLTVTTSANISIFTNGNVNAAGDTVSISGLKLTGANQGAINNSGNLTVTNVVFESNTERGALVNTNLGTANVTGCLFSANTSAFGGSLNNDGTLTVTDTTFTGNTGGNGGAISNDSTMSVFGCTFADNRAISGSATGLGGGAIYSNSGTNPTRIENSTFTANAETGGSGGGGGISNRSGSMTVANSTFTSNTGFDGGGAISNRGSLSISSSKFSQNSASGPNAQQAGQGSGGAILTQGGGDLTITDSIITGNSSMAHGGGIYFQPNATVPPLMVITNTTISGNRCNTDRVGAGDGGGISSDGSGFATISRSTISGNTAFTAPNVVGGAGKGGGIYSLRKLNVDNCTVSGNSAESDGGGIFDAYPGGGNSEVVITNSTIVFNQGARGGGVYSSASVGDTPASLGNTIVAGNTAGQGADVFNLFGSQGFNLIGGDAKLGALADNGGPTPTHALLPGSPAIDQGKRLSDTTTDQRGVTRPTDDPAIANADGGDGSDIGAYEIGAGNGVNTKTLGNIATRLPVLTGENVLIAGIIVVGDVPKRVMIRALGPSLAAAGVSGALEDPIVELYEGDTLLAANDDWRNDQQDEIAATGIAPSDNREAAIVRTLAPGAYTAIVSGKDGTTGIALVEGYDLDQRDNSKLGNISTRGFVGSGEDVLIGGFIVGPSTRVVVRALGPSLGNGGVQGALQDPTLELVDSNGAVVRTNDNWKGTQQSELEAIGIQPSEDRESALIATLTAGNYTAVVRGVGANTGVGLVEVYNLP